MTFELFIYRAHIFATGLQTKKGKFGLYLAAFGGMIVQFLMAASYARTLQQGEKIWRQKSVKRAKKKSAKPKQPAPPAGSSSLN